MAPEILRKLTIKNCGFGIPEVKATVSEENPTAELLKVVGVTTSAKAGQTDKGEFLRLMGTFRAVNMQTGEVFDSPQAILPSFISDSLAEALKASPEVEFAILIGAKHDPDSITGYMYTVRPLIETKPSDKMAALLAASGANNPVALPAPKEKTKKAA